jgi:hypothetical protein
MIGWHRAFVAEEQRGALPLDAVGAFTRCQLAIQRARRRSAGQRDPPLPARQQRHGSRPSHAAGRQTAHGDGVVDDDDLGRQSKVWHGVGAISRV